MLFENEVFVHATHELLCSVARRPDCSAVFDAAYETTEMESVTLETSVCPEIATMETWTEVFYPFYNKLAHPVDALIEIVDHDGETLGWHVIVWYNGDDLDDNYDYEKDTEEWD